MFIPKRIHLSGRLVGISSVAANVLKNSDFSIAVEKQKAFSEIIFY